MCVCVYVVCAGADDTTESDFTLGEQAVIEAWEQGVVGMREGGVRWLVIPPHLSYGDIGRSPLPPCDTEYVEHIHQLCGV